ncbi:Uncharacterized membrane protein [Candidatus Kryptonium thompsonii]|uniref:Uncharacterized membrane protein n=3 Tax=Candidatus Kryptonium thompsonii TaxID=1633631 RepID=A0A0P1LRE5_9BACT|nr:DUF2231 domain-containing protein [Candidatus Kryptonium thompsoni]CUS80120.1 Uncharacterized membrane protein [Candidatus Kryptonium thompsoni]CUS80681.1 Uncharacterized membrane protein [Candidatus Kryptonium thompsoni]CUS84444.1 Uncharacterized membrane protein [Candidatus Kryptonium thompsoni]CUS88242.1 Uncharacterized membrane protein [Candidatus Kryptonium thompsoni]CUS89801.1 Uncharacterized membrane protein [Candidatus Kryptonium thompsoni]
MTRIFSVFILMLIISIAAFAHGKERHDKKDTLKTNVDTLKTIQNVQPYKIKLSENLLEHVHNKIVHFPVAFVVAGFILTILGFKWDKFSSSVNLLIFFAGVFAIAAYLTGVLQESAFEDTSKEWVVETHETLGIVTAISIWVWFLFLSVKRLKRFSWLIGLITFVLVLVTGFYGGVLAHG